KTTGIDWSQLYKLQDIDVSIDKLFHKNISKFEDNKITTAIAGGGASENSHLIKLSASGSLNEVIKFLKTQGDVTSISNPKVLTLNNQAALITAGTEYFYKITSTETLSGTTSGTQSTSEDVQSVFAGVLLDITPEISDDNTITLKINPSLSETASSTFIADSAEDRTMPPDLRRRQLSSVVTVKDGNRIILGGLINTSNIVNMNKLPILGDIPILNYLFKYEDRQKITQELVIVIQPRIIAKDKKDLSLADLGYQGLSEKVLLNAKDAITTTEDIAKEEN
ncbi:MAG: ral secretion pathway protein, partial [Campylobacterota bacterium]|nr:ral secretion pathway protein [Campylobacterota bacterium]